MSTSDAPPPTPPAPSTPSPHAPALAIVSRTIVTPDALFDGAMLVDDGRISAVIDRTTVSPPAFAAFLEGREVHDHSDHVVLPGLVDSHVHVNEPGRTEWEGWQTAAAAALAGGITTLVDMPLNSSPVTTTVAALDAKRAAVASAGVAVRAEYWGGLVPGMTADDIAALAAAGVRGFKCFMCDSGIDEFGAVTLDDVAAAMPAIAAAGLPLLAHAELVPADGGPAFTGDERSHAAWAATRPPSFEHDAVAALVALAHDTGCQLHIVHVSSAGSVDLISGEGITWETCPHYLLMPAEAVTDGSTHCKCAPPLRPAAEIAELWERVIRDLPAIVSDHSPAPPATKSIETGSFRTAWGGISSLGLQLPLMHTALGALLSDGEVPDGVDAGTHAEMASTALYGALATMLAGRPAAVAGVDHERGVIHIGMRADLAVLDPDAEWVISGAEAGWRWPLTPYERSHVRGRVSATYVGGRLVFSRQR